MKSRELQKYLGTIRTIHASDGLICVASAYVNNLVTLNVETGNLAYALGGRSKDAELEKICQGLESLTKEQRDYYWSGADEIDKPITLYYADDKGNLKTAITDISDFRLGFPNITNDGVLIYSNTHFETKEDLLRYEVSNTKLGIKWLEDSVVEKHKAWKDSQQTLCDHTEKLANLELALSEVKNG